MGESAVSNRVKGGLKKIDCRLRERGGGVVGGINQIPPSLKRIKSHKFHNVTALIELRRQLAFLVKTIRGIFTFSHLKTSSSAFTGNYKAILTKTYHSYI